MLRARCPSCRKSATLNEADAGQPVVCLACGQRYLAPDLSDSSSAAAPGDAPAAAAPAAPRVGRTFWIALALGVVAGAACIALVLRVRPGPLDRATAQALAAEASAHAAEGRLVEAHKKYHELETLVAGRSVSDPETRRVVDDAIAEKQRVYERLLRQVESDRSAARPSATTGPVATVAAPADPVIDPPALVNTGTQPVQATGPAEVAATAPATGPTAVAATAPAPPDVMPTSAQVGGEALAAVDPSPPPSPGRATPVGPSTPTTAAVTTVLGRPSIRPMPEAAEGITDEQIGRAIQSGVDYLLSRFDPLRHTLDGADTSNADGGGPNALAVYALMQAGQAVSDPRLNVRGKEMDAKIEAMKDSRLRRGRSQTYATGIRATALALFNRPQDKAVLRQDVLGLLQSHTQGAYSYSIDPNRARQRDKIVWDNSNSQYGLLGVWSGAEAAVEVPSSYWEAVEGHWVETQLKNGQWGYAGGHAGRLTMTSAGIASLFVTHDWLDAPKYARAVGRDPFPPALQRGLEWFETGDNAVQTNSEYWGYNLYGIERVGLASGLKYFGRHDWYRHLAAEVVAKQASDGSWGDVVDTSFALLFLSRGRHPVMMNKVRFNGYWANRPRDVANLARFAARQLERELNWQVVPLRPAKEWTDWLDSPILYLASHKAPALLDSDYDNLRQFVAAGGLLYTQADGDDPEFTKWAAELAATLFPKYEMKDLPSDHPIYNLVYKLEQDDRPALKGVSNGARLLMVHSPTDISRSWQTRDTRGRKGAFQLGINLFLYAAGKRDLRNRLESTFVSDPGKPLNGSVSLVRLEYGGNWNPEPDAWGRFARWFQRQTGTGLNVSSTRVASLQPGPAIAALTGTARYDFTQEEVATVKNFVESGGVLLADECGGTGPFSLSVDDMLSKAFPQSKMAPLDPATHPLFRGGAPASGLDDLTKPKYRQFSVPGRYDEAAPILGFRAGKGHVLFTSIDITSGLLGTRTWGIAGLHPDYAAPFVKNLIFWTVDGQVDE